MTQRKYILKDKLAIPCDDLITWAEWFGTADRTVARTVIEGIVISTVFLGLDHRVGKGEPLLFETMIFIDQEHAESIPFQRVEANDSLWFNARRDTFWWDAEATHRNACAEIARRLQQSKAVTNKALAAAHAAEPMLLLPWLKFAPE